MRKCRSVMRRRERCQLLRVSCVSFSFQNSPICKNEKVLPEKVRLPESSCFTIVSTILPPYMHSLQVSHNSNRQHFVFPGGGFPPCTWSIARADDTGMTSTPSPPSPQPPYQPLGWSYRYHIPFGSSPSLRSSMQGTTQSPCVNSISGK